MKRRIIILLVVALVVVLGLIFLWPRNSYRRAVEAYKQELIAKGEKLTISELVPPTTTNAASNATRFLNAVSGYSYPVDYPALMKVVAPGVALAGHTNLTPAQIAGYERLVPMAAGLRTALDVPVLDFSVDYLAVARQNSSSLLNYLSKLKVGEFLLADTAMRALNQKDNSEAALDLNAAVDMVRLNHHETLLIADLVHEAVSRIAVAATWEALQTDQLTDRQLADLEGKWQDLDLFGSSESALPMEMALNIETYDWFRKSANPFATQAAGLVPGGSGEEISWSDSLKHDVDRFYDRYPRYWIWRSTWSFDEELGCLEIYDAQLTASRRTKSTGAFAPALREYDQAAAKINDHYRNGGSHFILFYGSDSARNYLLKLANGETARRLTVIAIALKRYQLQHNAYPARLDELVPTFLAQVPIDFMDGKPLRYNLRPDGSFLLYSVGEDGEDNGGDATPTTGTSWMYGRDIVWPRAATAEEAAAYAKPAPRAGGMRDAPPGTIPPRPEPKPPGL